jgi:hypothetical protein
MSLATDPLPANPSALRIFAADLQAELARKDIEIAANAAEIHAKTLHIEKLKMQLAVLRRARFGRSSEKLNRDIEQLELLIGALEQDAAAEDARTGTAEPDTKADPKTPAKTRQRKQPVRAPLPAHLPRETVTPEPACTCPGCGGTTFSRIGQDEREVLEYVPSSFKVIQHVRPKLSCRACETIVQAPMPSLPIERGPDQRVAAREEHARPLLVQLKAFLDTSLNRVSGKSALAQAIRYALSRWKALTRYITDGRLEMSNNAAERAMKPPVLGRKNYLFCGSDAGGIWRTSIVLSL